MKKKSMLLKVVVMIISILLSGLLSDPLFAGDKPRVAIVFATGGLGDKSFNDAAMQGIKQAIKKYGIKYNYAEPKAITEYHTYLSQFATTRRYDLIISIGFDQADALANVAGRFKEQKFAIVDMVVDKPNVASFIYKEQERGLLSSLLFCPESVGLLHSLPTLLPMFPRLRKVISTLLSWR